MVTLPPRPWSRPRVEELATDPASARRIIRRAKRICVKATISSTRVNDDRRFTTYVTVTRAQALRAIDDGYAESARRPELAPPFILLDAADDYCWIGGC